MDRPPVHRSARDRFEPIRILRGTPGHVWMITGLFAMLLASWSILVPQYHAPDEPNHVDAVMRLVQGQGWPPPGSAFVTPEGIGAIREAPYGSRENPYDLTSGPIPGGDAISRSDRPEWDDLAEPSQPQGFLQQLVQHPPLYYWTNAVVLLAIPGGGDTLRWDMTIGLLRIINVLMVAPLPLLANAAARCLHPSPVAGTVAALVPPAVPQLVHIGSSVNNDNLLILLGGLVTVAVAHVLRGDTSLRTAWWTGLFTGLALLTKSLAVALVPLVVGAYLTAWLRRPPGAGYARNLLPPALAIVIAIAAGGWWWVVNIVRWGTFQPRVPGFPPGEYVGGDWTVYWQWMSAELLRRWWGSIGWYEVDLGFPLVLTATIVFAGSAAPGLIRARNRADRVDLLFMILPTVTLIILVGANAAIGVADTGHITGISGRYLFAGITGLAVLIGTGAATFPPRVARRAPVVFLLAAGAVQWVAVGSVLNHFWRPDGEDLTAAWNALTAWSPWAPSGVGAVFGATLALALVTAIALEGQRRLGHRGAFADPAVPVIDARRLDMSLQPHRGPDLPPVVSPSGNVEVLTPSTGGWPRPPSGNRHRSGPYP